VNGDDDSEEESAEEKPKRGAPALELVFGVGSKKKDR
jgi:hypothetical protein